MQSFEKISIMETTFSKLVDTIYHLPLEEKQELMNPLGRNISEDRRNDKYNNFVFTRNEEKNQKLVFSSDLNDL